MILFKAAGNTYQRVAGKELHAFPFSPAEVRPGEFVLLSKNREDCRPTEQQIQFAAKLLDVRPASPRELEEDFPGVGAGVRFKYKVRLFWTSKLDHPFSLSMVKGVNWHRYDTVQHFARIDEADERQILDFLIRSNPKVVLDFVNNADPNGRGP